MPDRPAVPAPSTTYTYTYDEAGFWVVSVTVRGVGTWTYVTHIDPSGAAS